MSNKRKKKVLVEGIKKTEKKRNVGDIVRLESELKKKSKGTSAKECDELGLWDKLLDVLVKSGSGCAISASQIGILKNAILVCDFENGEIKSQTRFINPVIMDTTDLTVFKGETCLSYPGRELDTVRYGRIIIKDDLNGNKTYTGHMAFLLQHCVDHLNGIVFVDRQVEEPKKEVKTEAKKEIKKEVGKETKKIEEKKLRELAKKQKKLKRKFRKKRKMVKTTVRHGTIKTRK